MAFTFKKTRLSLALAAPHPNEETPPKGRIQPFPAGSRGGDRILNRRLLRCERNLASTANTMKTCGYVPLVPQIRHSRFIPTRGVQQLQHSRIRHATAGSRTRLWSGCGADPSRSFVEGALARTRPARPGSRLSPVRTRLLAATPKLGVDRVIVELANLRNVWLTATGKDGWSSSSTGSPIPPLRPRSRCDPSSTCASAIVNGSLNSANAPPTPTVSTTTSSPTR
jgi:hypothetical protein